MDMAEHWNNRKVLSWDLEQKFDRLRKLSHELKNAKDARTFVENLMIVNSLTNSLSAEVASLVK